MAKQVIENKNLDKTRKFIESNFKISKEIQINIFNFKKLITFINENNIRLDYYDLRCLVEYSYKLESTIKILSQRNTFNRIFEGIDGEIQRIYLDLVKILNENKEKSKTYKNSDFKDFNNYQKNILKNTKITHEKQNELLEKISNGDSKAKEELIIAYLPLVLGIASKYEYAWNYEDLVQIGTLGLIKAINNYNYEKGKNFYKYLNLSIKRNIYNSIYSEIKIGYLSYSRMQLILKLMIEYYFKYNKILTDEEISNITNFDIEAIKKYKTLIKFKFLENDNSFDRLNLNNELVDFTEENRNIELGYNDKLRKILNNISFTQREKEVIKLFYFDNIENASEIGKLLGISRERVKQLKTSALKRCRNDYELMKYYGLNNDFEEKFNDIENYHNQKKLVNSKE